MIGRSKLLLLFFLITLTISVNASSLGVSIVPKNKAVEILQLYPNEVGELEIAVTNNGSEALENINIKVSMEGITKIVKEGFATNVLNEAIESLQPNETKYVFVSVKPTELSKEKQFVYVNYGFETFTHFAATYVEIAESPLEVQARLNKSALDIAEKSKLVLKIKNRSNGPVGNIKAEMVFPQDVTAKSPALQVDLLSPGESISDKEFLFEVDPAVTGEKKIVLLVSFEDSFGKHIIERDFLIDVQDRRTVLYLIIIAIIALIVVALYLKQRPSHENKPLEAPEVTELEGKELEKKLLEKKEIKK